MPARISSPISWWFIAAALANVSIAAIHVLAGAPEIIEPILAASLADGVKGVADVLWHHVTGMLLLAGAACAWAARHPDWRRPVAILVGAQYMLISVLFVGFGIYWFASPWPMPQWVLFTATTVLMALGAARMGGAREQPGARAPSGAA